MKKDKKMKNKKKLIILAATITIAILLSAATFAWMNFQQRITNEFNGNKPGGTGHDDFDGPNKDVYIENWGSANLYVRIRLDEYMELGEGAGKKGVLNNGVWTPDPENKAVSLIPGANINDKTTWQPHIPYNAKVAECDTPADFHDYWKWEMGGGKIYKPVPPDKRTDPAYVDQNKTVYTSLSQEAGLKQTLNATVVTMDYWINTLNRAVGPYWVIDADGWAYWAAPLKPGEATGLLLNAVELANAPEDPYYYAINVIYQMATKDGEYNYKTFYDGADKDHNATDNGKNLLDLITKSTGYITNDKSLYFDTADGKFYLMKDNNKELYTGQSDKWSWNNATKTLALNGFAWETTAFTPLHINGDITLEIKGNNTFKTSGFSETPPIKDPDDPDSMPILVPGAWAVGTLDNLTITGDGTLNLIADYEGFASNIGIATFSDFKVDMANSGKLNIYSGDKGQSNTGISAFNLIVNNGLVNVISGNRGIRISPLNPSGFTLNGGTVITQGGESAFFLGQNIIMNLPASYTYWTNTAATATGAIEKKYPQDGAFVNSETYKYVKIESGTKVNNNDDWGKDLTGTRDDIGKYFLVDGGWWSVIDVDKNGNLLIINTFGSIYSKFGDTNIYAGSNLETAMKNIYTNNLDKLKEVAKPVDLSNEISQVSNTGTLTCFALSKEEGLIFINIIGPKDGDEIPAVIRTFWLRTPVDGNPNQAYTVNHNWTNITAANIIQNDIHVYPALWIRVPGEIPATSIEIIGDSKALSLGEKYTPGYIISPPNSTDVPIWTSSDDSVATVDPITGEITMKGDGPPCIITVKAGEAGNVWAYIWVALKIGN